MREYVPDNYDLFVAHERRRNPGIPRRFMALKDQDRPVKEDPVPKPQKIVEIEQMGLVEAAILSGRIRG